MTDLQINRICIHYGTVIVGLLRKDFVVLAADRLAVYGDSDNPIRMDFDFDKITSHPQLPIAIAVCGMASVVKGRFGHPEGELLIRDYLESEIIGKITTPKDLDKTTLVRTIEAGLYPLFVNTVAYIRAGLMAGIERTSLYVAMFSKDGPALFAIEMTDLFNLNNNYMLNFVDRPTSLPECLTFDSPESESRLFGNHLSLPDEVALHARDMARIAIDHEKRKFGRHRECGGEIDLVIVDKLGARRLKFD